MANEVTLQGQLMRGEAVPATGQFARVRARRILQELRDQFQQSPLKEGRQVTYQGRSQSSVLVTDASLVVRILRNMVTNALEASQPGEEIRVSFEEGADQAVFTVWNARAIPSEVALRVFQRNFSTKGGLGRGLGTWSMKFFGEQILRGEVGFSSSPEEGTAFVLRLPMQSGRRSEI